MKQCPWIDFKFSSPYAVYNHLRLDRGVTNDLSLQLFEFLDLPHWAFLSHSIYFSLSVCMYVFYVCLSVYMHVCMYVAYCTMSRQAIFSIG